MPPGHQADEMQHMANMASSGTMGTHSSLSQSFSNMADDNDDYMDYMGGGSPLGLSSESSNQDRSCTSTPVGNDSSPAGEDSSPSSSIIITFIYHHEYFILGSIKENVWFKWIEINRRLKMAVIS